MISIITPTHNSKYIYELWETIKKQTFKDWEWIIVPNGTRVKIKHEKVRIIKHPKTKSIGKLKKFACNQARGDIIAEIDHDDLITPNCLEEVSRAFTKGIGFVYSDNLKYTDNFIPYNPHYNWKYKKVKWREKEYYSMNSFPATAGSLSYIWFAPDHIRAWKKDVYDKIGGHRELEVCDDHDLMCRMYLETRFKKIDKCLYIYRITGDNTWLKKNKKVQEITQQLYKKYIYRLAEREADLKGLLKIDLGGGFNKPKGYKSIDIKNGDITADLNKKIPLPDNSVGVVRAWDILEHLTDKQAIIGEIWRVLDDGGFLLSKTPSTDGRGAFQDPTHISYWNENSFWYWTRPEQMKYIYNDKIVFSPHRLETAKTTQWEIENNIPYVIADLMAIKNNKYKPKL